MGSTICGKSAYFIGLLAITLGILSFPAAADGVTCNGVAEENLELCNEIKSISVDDDAKQQLIADLAYQDRYYANHTGIYDWNTGLNFNTAPSGVETKSNGYIRDAWLNIIAIMPSAISEDKLLTPGIGEILSAYNYKVELPTGTEPGDCRTDINLQSDNAWLDVSLNGNSIGTSTLASFAEPDTLNFKDSLKIETVTKVDHYETHRWCCKRRGGRCKKVCEECRLRNTEYRTHEVNLEDTKTAYQYRPIIMPKIKAVDKYSDTLFGILNISNFDAFKLNFENSSFGQFNYYYDIVMSFKPYNVFTLRANRFTKEESNNLNLQKFDSIYEFYVSNPDQCKLRFFDHFNSWEQECNLDFEFPEMSVDTDKLAYDENEIIIVDLEPKNTLMSVKYGNQEVFGSNSVQFEAEKNVNKITIELDGRETQRIIHIKNDEVWDLALNLIVFSGVVYVFYLLVKKYFVWFNPRG
jgi:hypothetical protein